MSSIKTVTSWKPGERVYSIKQLEQAAYVRIDPSRPISRYFKSLESTLAKAQEKLLDQDLQSAYVFYLRYTSIAIHELSTHPDYHKKEYAQNRKQLMKNCANALTNLEKMQPILQKRYEVYLQYLESLPKPSAAVSTYSSRRHSRSNAVIPMAKRENSTKHHIPKIHLSREDDEARHGFSMADALRDLNVGTHKLSEIPESQIPAIIVQPSDQPLIDYPSLDSYENTMYNSKPYANTSQSSSGSLMDHDTATPATSQMAAPLHPTSRHASQTIPQKPLPPLPPRPRIPPSISHAPQQPQSPHYAPSAPQTTSIQLPVVFTPQSQLQDVSGHPMLPPKPQEYCNGYEVSTPEQGQELTALVSSSDVRDIIVRPDHYTETEGGVRMRSVQLPDELPEEFLRIASDNTNANLETCGILCGKIVDSTHLIITTLIIPKQHATSDTCTTEHEEEMMVMQMDLDLITLGWIHTHPSQTCFMSSLDLHTHCSYQLMLPEAIAIVCSPKHDPRFGFFRLTDPYGLDVIQKCKEKSTFHPHDQSVTIYTDADSGGHIIKSDYSFDIIDLRNA